MTTYLLPYSYSTHALTQRNLNIPSKGSPFIGPGA